MFEPKRTTPALSQRQQKISPSFWVFLSQESPQLNALKFFGYLCIFALPEVSKNIAGFPFKKRRIMVRIFNFCKVAVKIDNYLLSRSIRGTSLTDFPAANEILFLTDKCLLKFPF